MGGLVYFNVMVTLPGTPRRSGLRFQELVHLRTLELREKGKLRNGLAKK